MNFLKDLDVDYLRDQVKDFFKSKSFIFISLFLFGYMFYFLNDKRVASKQAEIASRSIVNHDYEEMKVLIAQHKNRYDFLRIILAAEFLNGDFAEHEEEFNSLLTGIKDGTFRHLFEVWSSFKNKKKLDVFKSMNSPWKYLAEELDVVNGFAEPRNHILLPILAISESN